LLVTGINAVTPAVSADGTRIAWASRINDHNIYSIPIRGGKPSKIVATTEYESNPALAPDGRLAYVSHRSGSAEIWIGAADGANAVRVTKLGKGSTANLAWSPDGTRLLFESSADGNTGIFSIECPPKTAECGSPSRISPKMHPATGPSWSADGNFIYFTAGEREHPQIWKRPAAGGNAVQLAGSAGQRPRESRDGKWLYYFRWATTETVTIWRIPVADGTDRQVKAELVVGPPHRPSEYWTLAGNEVVFFDRGDKSNAAAFRAYHTVTKQVRTIVELGESHGQHPAMSPDGRTLFYSRLDRSGANIMVAWLRR
jgi:Tol biopolymer transport system component